MSRWWKSDRSWNNVESGNSGARGLLPWRLTSEETHEEVIRFDIFLEKENTTINQVKAVEIWDFFGCENELEIKGKNSEGKSLQEFAHGPEELKEILNQHNGEYQLWGGINERKEGGTKNEDVKRLLNIVLDVEHKERPDEGPVSEELMEETLDVASDIRNWLHDQDINCTVVNSGGGFHVWIPLEPIILTEGDRKEKIAKYRKFYEVVKDKFETPKVKIDPTKDPARVIGIPHTYNVKREAPRIPTNKTLIRESGRKATEFLLDLELKGKKAKIDHDSEAEPPFENEYGWKLEEIRKYDDDLDLLLTELWPDDYTSKSEADFSACEKLYYWEFSDEQIVRIIKKYRTREKVLKRDDYHERNLSNIDREKQISDDVNPEKWHPKSGYKKSIEPSKEPSPPEPDKSHENVAFLLMEENHFRTLRDTEKVLYYEKGVYKEGGESIIKEKTEEIMKGSGDKLTNYFAKQVIGHIQRKTYVNREEFDNDSNIMNVKNGLLNLETGELKDHDPEYLSRKQLPIKYNPEADCPKIKQFFKDIVHEEDVPVLEEIFGFILMDGYPIHKAIIPVGEGRNGKSTFNNLIRDFVGEENASQISLHELATEKFARAQLEGKLVNTGYDMSSKALKHTSIFKAVTGEDEITAQRKNKPLFNFTNSAKMILPTNEIPPTYDMTDAFFHRCLPIEFPNKFVGEDEDPSIIEKLTTEEELSGLLNLAIEARKRLIGQGGFTRTKESKEREQHYQKLFNPIRAFIEEKCLVGENYRVPKATLYGEFGKFARNNRIHMMSKSTFTKRLQREEYVTTYRPKIDGSRIRCYKGITLKDNPQYVTGKEGNGNGNRSQNQLL